MNTNLDHSSRDSSSNSEPECDSEACADLENESAGLSVELILETQDVDPLVSGWLEVMLARAAFIAAAPNGQINLALVDDEAMSECHEQYCGVPGTTDVITFDHRDEDQIPHGDLEADLVLCVDEAKRQAAKRGHTVRKELLLYAVHGLLHLLGEDDHEEEDYQRMHEREDQILAALGVGPVFTRPAEPQ